jgi:8-oxo-dGTP diphosphatase
VILLVRHGRAGRRGHADPHDSRRPLDKRGLAQARALPALLTGFEIERIFSSRFTRCIETVEPLAEERGLEVMQRNELADDARDEARRFLESLTAGSVACTHGDVIAAVLGPRRTAKKGSVWVLEPATLKPTAYLDPR